MPILEFGGMTLSTSWCLANVKSLLKKWLVCLLIILPLSLKTLVITMSKEPSSLVWAIRPDCLQWSILKGVIRLESLQRIFQVTNRQGDITMQDFDFERYKSLDISNAKSARLNPVIKQLQDNLGVKAPQDELTSFFDSDVQQVIKQHNTPKDRERVNQMIRLLFATTWNPNDLQRTWTKNLIFQPLSEQTKYQHCNSLDRLINTANKPKCLMMTYWLGLASKTKIPSATSTRWYATSWRFNKDKRWADDSLPNTNTLRGVFYWLMSWFCSS